MKITPGSVSLKELENIFTNDLSIKLCLSSKKQIDKSAEIVKRASADLTPVYGVNTGFGKLASKKIGLKDIQKLQHNLILSHCSGVGTPIHENMVRFIIVLKLISLGRGASGVRWDVCNLLEKMLERRVSPVIPSQGSVGASGDLAPLAHLAAVLIGEGKATFEGELLSAKDALYSADLSPIKLGPKEGLALINGTQFSTAFALSGLFSAQKAISNSILIAAMSTDAVMGSTAPLRPEIHKLRGHSGQIEVAKKMRSLMKGSEIRESHRTGDKRVQDPYCIRCQPQVVGAALDILNAVGHTLMVEANAVTDNPLVIAEEKIILSGGNFHGEPVGFAADQIALALAEIGAISQRRVALMVDPSLNYDLPPFLTPQPGLNSGFMVAEVTTAALMSENKHLANPCVTDSTPTSANQEDHVSMSAHGSYRLVKMNKNLNIIHAIEAMCAAQGIEARAPLKTSNSLSLVLKKIREVIPSLKEDRYMALDIEVMTKLIESNSLIRSLET